MCLLQQLLSSLVLLPSFLTENISKLQLAYYEQMTNKRQLVHLFTDKFQSTFS